MITVGKNVDNKVLYGTVHFCATTKVTLLISLLIVSQVAQPM